MLSCNWASFISLILKVVLIIFVYGCTSSCFGWIRLASHFQFQVLFRYLNYKWGSCLCCHGILLGIAVSTCDRFLIWQNFLLIWFEEVKRLLFWCCADLILELVFKKSARFELFDFLQERLQEIPTAAPSSSESQFYPQTGDLLAALPGSEADQSFLPANAQVFCVL